MDPQGTPAPAWFVVPEAPHISRWWDGTRWADDIVVTANRTVANRTTVPAFLESWRRRMVLLWVLVGVAGVIYVAFIVVILFALGWRMSIDIALFGLLLVGLVVVTIVQQSRFQRLRTALLGEAPLSGGIEARPRSRFAR